MWKCLNCGHEVIWQNDFNFEDYCMEGEGLVQVFHCPHCGADITVMIPDKNEEDS